MQADPEGQNKMSYSIKISLSGKLADFYLVDRITGTEVGAGWGRGGGLIHILPPVFNKYK